MPRTKAVADATETEKTSASLEAAESNSTEAVDESVSEEPTKVVTMDDKEELQLPAEEETGGSDLGDNMTEGEEDGGDGNSEGGEDAPADLPEGVSRQYLARNVPEGLTSSPEKLVKAGKRKRRQLYGGDTVMTENGAVRSNAANSQRRKEYLELAQSANARKILTGTLVTTSQTGTNRVLAEISYGEHFTVKIPAEFLCDLSMQPEQIFAIIKRRDETATNTLKDIIHKRLGAPVSFIVLQVDEREGIAIASHIDAMVEMARANYTMRGGNAPKVRKGDLAEGTVMQVNTLGIWVEVIGVETFIRNSELSWFRYQDVSTQYNVGDKVTVKILEVEKHTIHAEIRDLNTVKITASVKQATQNPNVKFFDKYEIGQSGAALVAHITDRDIFVIFGGRISVRCNHPKDMDIPPFGSTVMVKIVNKRDDEHLFTGEIRHIIKRPDSDI